MRETSGKHGEEVDEEESSRSSNNTLGAADSLLLCLSILRERKKERKREREIKEISISSLRCSFPPKRQESTDERDKNRTTNVSILVRFGHPKRFLVFGVRKRLRRRTKRYAPGDDFDDESGFFVFLFFFEKQRLH
jgi:hypothetical protein